MYKWKPHDINDPFKMRTGEKLVNVDNYADMLKRYNIPFTQEQYEEAKKNLIGSN